MAAIGKFENLNRTFFAKIVFNEKNNLKLMQNGKNYFPLQTVLRHIT